MEPLQTSEDTPVKEKPQTYNGFITGYIKPDFVGEFNADLTPEGKMNPVEADFIDARQLQGDDSPSEFFKKFGFCLIKNPTAVKVWNTDMKNRENDIT